jgi:hypothetical protein
MLSRRYGVTLANLRSGAERRITLSLPPALVILFSIVTLPVLIGIGVAWKVSSDAQRVRARNRVLEIETANYRATTESLAQQIESLQASIPVLGAGASGATGAGLTALPLRPAFTNPPSAAAGSVPLHGEPASPSAGATAHPTETTGTESAGGGGADSDALAASTEPGQSTDVLARVVPARKAAEDANAQALARDSYQSAVAFEIEARQFANSGRASDAVLKALVAEARFRLAETEARTEAAVQERVRVVGAQPVQSGTESPARAADSRRGESSSPEPESTVLTPEAEDKIKDVIAQYVAGLETRNLVALKRVWPSLGGNQEKALRTEFANARSVQALFHDSRITVNNGNTTVTGIRTYALETLDGQQLFTTTRTTITLRRVGNEWVIERMVHLP